MRGVRPPRGPRPFPRPKGRPGAPFQHRPQGAGDVRDPLGHLYDPEYLGRAARAEVLAYLASIRPIWEFRYATDEEARDGRGQRVAPGAAANPYMVTLVHIWIRGKGRPAVAGFPPASVWML